MKEFWNLVYLVAMRNCYHYIRDRWLYERQSVKRAEARVAELELRLDPSDASAQRRCR